MFYDSRFYFQYSDASSSYNVSVLVPSLVVLVFFWSTIKAVWSLHAVISAEFYKFSFMCITSQVNWFCFDTLYHIVEQLCNMCDCWHNLADHCT